MAAPPEEGADPQLSPSKPFDLENFIGVRGAAWLGAIALAIAGTLFAKYSIENNLIPPAVRVAFLILLGLVALVGSETFLRRRYPETASPVCGAGIAILYAAFYSAHAVYDLIGLPATFALMVLNTVVAALLSVRYNAVFIAILGLLGGFATPLLLSSGRDRPIGLFAYVLMLDAGFLAISLRKRWNHVVLISFVATLLLEVAWAGKQLAPHKLPVALSIFFLFGLLYFLLPALSRYLVPADAAAGDGTTGTPSPHDQQGQLLQMAVVSGLAPLLFGVSVASSREYAAQWPLLLGYMACLDVALIVVGIRRRQTFLALAAALATEATIALHLGSTAQPLAGVVWSFTLSVIALSAILNLAGRADGWLAPAATVGPPRDATTDISAAPVELSPRALLEAAGLVGLAGLLGYMLYFIYSAAMTPHGNTLWPLLLLSLVSLGLTHERSEPSAGRIAWLTPLAAAALGLIQILWLVMQPSEHLSGGGLSIPPDHFVRHLAVPLLTAVLAGLLASARARRAKPDPRAAVISELSAAVLASLGAIGIIVLTGTGPGLLLPMTPGLGFFALGLYLLLLWLSALRRNYTFLLPLCVALVSTLSFTVVSVYHHAGDEASLLPWMFGYVLLLTALPLLALSLRAPWRGRRGPYLASALTGPALFLPVLSLVTDAIGKRVIGLLPLLFSALAVLGLAAVGRLPAVSDAQRAALGDAVVRRRALGNQALFAAVALGFVAVAIPLQLDRQWIIVGWALEAAAVWWLYRRLPHIGLKYFGVALFAAVLTRLFPDEAFRHYQERGPIVLNWLLYTYGVPSACFIVGARGLSDVEGTYRATWEDQLPVGSSRFPLYALSYLIGLLAVFVLINLEIADAFSAGRYVDWSWEHSYARDLTVSLSWGLYGLVLLSIGMWKKSRALRFVSLGFMMLTIAKVFLYDLSNIRGIYRPLSFLGLAVSLIIVSLLYQRFVFKREPQPKTKTP